MPDEDRRFFELEHELLVVIHDLPEADIRVRSGERRNARMSRSMPGQLGAYTL